MIPLNAYLRLPVLTALLVLTGAPVCYAELCIGTVQVEHQTAPLGIDVTKPTLGWSLDSAKRGARQTGYQVLAASSPAQLEEGKADLWDSGKIQSDATVVSYQGKPLVSSQQVYWKVRVWDEASQPSAWSTPATWTVGILTPSDWRSTTRWITDPELLKWQRAHLGFSSKTTTDENTVKWLQLDLGGAHSIDSLVLHAVRHTVAERLGFPRRFKIEVSDDPAFTSAKVVFDQTAEDYNNAWTSRIAIPAGGNSGRYLRLTATRLRSFEGEARLALSQIEVLSDGKNIAPGSKVSASDALSDDHWQPGAVVDGLGVPGTNPHANETLLLRRKFTVKAGLKRALLHISGLGHYTLSVNGSPVDVGMFTPGWTEYTKTVLYDTHDLTTRLKAGDNALGLTLAGGMYNVQEGRYVKFVTAFRPLTTYGELRLEYDNGQSEIIGTDDQWHAAPGPITFANMFGGEDYDASKTAPGWATANFDDAKWRIAVVTNGPGGVLRGAAHAAPAFRAFETFAPIAKHDLRPDAVTYDFGQNASIIPRLRVKGPAGSVVRMIPAELIKPDGTVSRGSVGSGKCYWQYTLRGDAAGEEWLPNFFYHGSRYLQVEVSSPQGVPLPVIEKLEAVVVHSDSAPAGEFACSNELFNRIHSLVRWAQRSNLASVLTDCPHRERLGWLEQYHLNGPALRYEWDVTQLYNKTFGDMADVQTASGLVPNVAPEYIIFEKDFRDSPEWGATVILAAWQHYLWTGDDAPLRHNYPVMQRYLDYLTSKSSGHILSHGLGDWYDLGPKRPGSAQLTPVPLTATALYYECTKTLGRIAAYLGKAADAARYETATGEIRTAFNQKFFDREKRVYASGSQTAQALPLVLGLVEDSQRIPVFSALVKDIRERGNAITAGDVGYRYLLRALADAGRSDIIYAMNNQSDKPGYGYQLAQGATSLPEAWDANSGSSQNHFMLGQINEWFYHDLAGIQPDAGSPGFKHIVFKPTPVAGLAWVRANHHGTYGTIRSEWRRDGNRIIYNVTVPANCTATLYIPTENSNSVLGDDRPVSQVEGVRLVRLDARAAAIELGSGRYEFAAAAPRQE